MGQSDFAGVAAALPEAARADRERPFWETLVGQHAWRRVLDAGCGGGFHLRLLQGLGVRAVGLDLALTPLTSQRGAPVLAGDLLALPLRPACFDAVLCLGNTFSLLADRDSATGVAGAGGVAGSRRGAAGAGGRRRDHRKGRATPPHSGAAGREGARAGVRTAWEPGTDAGGCGGPRRRRRAPGCVAASHRRLPPRVPGAPSPVGRGRAADTARRCAAELVARPARPVEGRELRVASANLGS